MASLPTPADPPDAAPRPSLWRPAIFSRPFFEDKGRAFWRLQAAGWTGYLLLRSVSALSNGQSVSALVPAIIEAIIGYCITLLLSTLYGYYRHLPRISGIALTIATLGVASVVYATLEALTFPLIAPVPELGISLSRVVGYMFFTFTVLAGWSALYFGINFYLIVEEQNDQLERLGTQASAAQLAMLRYQLNPHFLFNTLNSISTLVLLKQTEPANAMLTRLSSFLRHTLVMQPGGKVSVAQEVDTLKLYLDIERMRFEERLRTDFRIDADAATARIPSMLLQPLVENAIKYGVSAQEEGARISLAAQVFGSRLRLTVSDTGPGIQSMQRQSDMLARGHSSTGVGLANISERLAQAYGKDHLFQIETPPDGGFTVVIELPLERDEPLEASPEALKHNPGPTVSDTSAMAGMSTAIGTTA